MNELAFQANELWGFKTWKFIKQEIFRKKHFFSKIKLQNFS